MTNRFPLIVDSVSQTIKELPIGDNLDLTGSGINGGTIDGTVIGGSTPAAISGTTGTFSGNLLVGTTNTSFSTAGTVLYGSDGVQIVRDGATALNLSRKTSDGGILGFFKDSTAVGSIGTNSSGLYIGTTEGSDSYLGFFSNAITPSDSTGAARDDAIDLGNSFRRFKDLYLSGQVKVGTGGRTRLQGGGIYDDSTNGNAVGIFFGGGQFIGPLNGSGNAVDNTVNIGSSSYRFKDLYLSGGVTGGNSTNPARFSHGRDDYITLADDASMRIDNGLAGSLIISVYDRAGGRGGVFHATYTGTVTSIASDGPWATSDTDGQYCVYKSASSHAVYFKNRIGSSGTFQISVFAAET